MLALVVGRGGPKMTESQGVPAAIDESAPLKPGQMAMDSADGPMRMTVGADGSASVDMGVRGIAVYKTDPATGAMHMDGRMMTMSGFAGMLTQFSQMAGAGARQIVDMTGLKGHYQVALDFSMQDFAAMTRGAGLDLPAVQNSSPAGAASDPGGSSLVTAVQALGLRLAPRRAMVEQLVIDHAEKTPTEN